MKASIVLASILLTTSVSAQVRTGMQPSTQAPPLTVNRNVQLADPKVAQLQQQMAELKQQQAELKTQLAELKEKNSELAYCLSELKHEVKELKSPTQNDGVTLLPPQGFGTVHCD